MLRGLVTPLPCNLTLRDIFGLGRESALGKMRQY
jgi:hypothetical protein